MKKIFKILGIIFLIFVVITLAGGGGGKIDQKSESTKKETQKKEKEVVKVEIGSFIKEFDENQLAAEKKYEGKIVELSGYIMNISEDIVGNPFISLDKTKEPNFNLTHVKCTFKSADELTGLKKGQLVTVKGEFKSQELGVIGLENCEIVE